MIESPFVWPIRVAETRYGPTLYLGTDQYVGRSLELYGEYSEGEVDLFRKILKEGDTVLEAGANIGAHTLPLARIVGEHGEIYAMEPQPFLCRLLDANLAVNMIKHVAAWGDALSDKIGETYMSPVDYRKAGNFGAMTADAFAGIAVETTKVDNFAMAPNLIKIDVEGMEAQVIRGAEKTIESYRPFLYVENDREEKSAELITLIMKMGYRLFWHTPPLFSPQNFAGNNSNAFPNIVSVNMLCIPNEEATKRTDLQCGPEILSPDSRWNHD